MKTRFKIFASLCLLPLLLTGCSKPGNDSSFESSSSIEETVEYVIDFDLNGGTSASYVGPQIVEEFTKDVFFFDCVKEGWNFRGWSYNDIKIFDEKGNQLATPVMARNMTFVAMYSQTAKMTIISNLEGAGDITGEGEYPYNSYVAVSAYANEGYVFVGWYYDGMLLSNANNYKYMMWSEDVTLEARFRLDSFLLTIRSNNQNYGLVILKSPTNNGYLPQYEEYRDYTVKITIAAYSKTDVRFLGWYDTENNLIGNTPVYDFAMPNHDYILEAKWNYFTVSYNLNGGTNDPTNPTSYTIDSIEGLILREPTKVGYDFLGWQYRGNYVTKIDSNWVDNITLDAVWKARSYSISYELNGGTNDPTNPTSYTIESDTIILQDASRFGYDFAGWYKTPTFDDKIIQISQGNYGDLALYAKWTPVFYSITYNLDGGTNSNDNPLTYTIESSFSFVSPSKVGYSFLGWFDENGNQITSISAGTTGALTLNARWNEGNEYVATLNPNGGEVITTSINVQYDHAYSLPEPTKLGYTFAGWYDGSTLISNNGIWVFASDKTFTAAWNIVYYNVNYALNGGTNDPTNPTTYTVEDNIILQEPARTGYMFLGWFDQNDNQISSIVAGTTGDLILSAQWTATKNNLSITSEDASKGTVSIVSGSGYSDESITVEATPTGDYLFKGWYHDGILVSTNAVFTFTMPQHDYYLVAHFYESEAHKYGTEPILSADGKTVTYGLYPQKNVNNPELISALNEIVAPESNGWYFYEDNYYAKFNATPCNPGYVFDNGTTVVEGTTYWFKCEPITWDVLSNDNGEYYILSRVVIDAHCFYNSSAERMVGGQTIYANNYEYSDIRAWLNNEFYYSAFALGSENILTTTVDNSASTTDLDGGLYACANTQDKVFLPSYQDCVNENYGFSASIKWPDPNRRRKESDWAIARGIYIWSQDEESYGEWSNRGYYWTRSPGGGSSYQTWIICYRGTLPGGGLVYDATNGVCPALIITIS